MKEFLIKIVVALIVALLFHLVAGLMAGGKTDAYYARFTTAPQSSLVLGTSRAAQGIQPAVLNKTLEQKEQDLPLYNFSFTALHSPYGPYYLRAIRKKLDSSTQNGLFLLEVNPLSISRLATNEEDDTLLYREKTLPLAQLQKMNRPINWEYLLHHYTKGWGSILMAHFTKSQMQIMPDGWLKIDIPLDSMSVKRRTQEKIKQYKNDLPTYAFSPKRLDYLQQTITMLQKHGTVLLVRLPIHPEILALENQLLPNFDSLMINLAQESNLNYINYTPNANEYHYTDGNHLTPASGQTLTQDLATKIHSSIHPFIQ